MKANVLMVMALLGLSASAKMTEVSLEGATAYAETTINADRSPVKAIDGSGLTPVAGYGWTHNATRENQWHGKNSGNSDKKNFATWYLVDFGSAKTFDVVRIWNAQEFSCRGVKDVEFYVSNSENYVPGAEPGFSSNDWTNVKTTTLAEDPKTVVGSTTYHLGEEVVLDRLCTARYFAIKIKSIIGGNSRTDYNAYGAICELKFFVRSLPDVSGDLRADPVFATSVKLNGTLNANTDTAPIDVFWGAADGGSDPQAWTNSKTYQDVPKGAFVLDLDGLVPTTDYVLRFRTYDSALDSYNWSEPLSFTTLASAAVVLSAVQDVTTSSATLVGELILSGAESGEVDVCWGGADGAVTGEWENRERIAVDHGAFTHALSELTPDQDCYAAFEAVGGSASETRRFTTAGVSVVMPADFYECESGTKTFRFTLSAASAEDVEVAYTLGGTAAEMYREELPGSITIPAGRTEAVIQIVPKNDADEGDKTLTITIEPGLYAVGCGTQSVTILDDETVEAKDPTWTNGTGDYVWETPGNWVARGGATMTSAPGVADIVTFRDGTDAEHPAVVSGQNLIKGLVLGGQSGVAAFADVVEGGRLEVRQNVRIGMGGAIGTLSVRGGSFIHNESDGELSVGYTGGEGHVVMSGGEFRSFGRLYLSHSENSVGTFDITGGEVELKSDKAEFVGNKGTGVLSISNAVFKLTGESPKSESLLRVGYSSGSRGVVNVHRGSTVSFTQGARIGDSGTGEWIQDGGNVTMKTLYLGLEGTGDGTYQMTAGNLNVTGWPLYVGYKGRGCLRLTNTTAGLKSEIKTDYQIVVGAEQGSFGRIEVDNATLTETNNQSNHGDGFIIGGKGHGELTGRLIALWSRDRGVIVARDEGSFGMIRGWGRVNIAKAFQTSGLVIADGLGEGDQELNLDASANENAVLLNPRDNTSTNGWYAVNQGRLVWRHQNVKTGGQVAVNFGESAADEDIDMVNSARIVFGNVTTAGEIEGALYAPDRTDVPAGCPIRAAGVWQLDSEAEFDTASLTFRYDHVAAPRGVSVLAYDERSGSWKSLAATVDAEKSQVTVTGVTSLGWFAVVPRAGMMILIK